MSIQNIREIIEKELTKIVNLFHTKLDFFYSRTELIDQIKVEPIDDISMEVTPLNSELRTDKVVTSTLIDIKER